MQATEARLGPPTFRNPSARFQQWEQPLTQIHYDQRGVIVEVGGSGAGVLCQGDLELIRCGEPEEARHNWEGYAGLPAAIYSVCATLRSM